MATKDNKKPKRMYPRNIEAFRNSCAMSLDLARDRQEKIADLMDRYEAAIDQRFVNNPQLLDRLTLWELVNMYAKLAETSCKFGKMSVEIYQLMTANYDESLEESKSKKETDDQKKVRKVSEKMLALISKRHADRQKSG